jgi:hypothetical protein
MRTFWESGRTGPLSDWPNARPQSTNTTPLIVLAALDRQHASLSGEPIILRGELKRVRIPPRSHYLLRAMTLFTADNL